jgi:hypothetical protein
MKSAIAVRGHLAGRTGRPVFGVHQNDLLGFRPLLELHRTLQSVNFS